MGIIEIGEKLGSSYSKKARKIYTKKLSFGEKTYREGGPARIGKKKPKVEE